MTNDKCINCAFYNGYFCSAFGCDYTPRGFRYDTITSNIYLVGTNKIEMPDELVINGVKYVKFKEEK